MWEVVKSQSGRETIEGGRVVSARVKRLWVAEKNVASLDELSSLRKRVHRTVEGSTGDRYPAQRGSKAMIEEVNMTKAFGTGYRTDDGEEGAARRRWRLWNFEDGCSKFGSNEFHRSLDCCSGVSMQRLHISSLP